jgi:hypothetical protein
MGSSEKIVLAICILSAIFLSTNLMLLPLLRGRRKSGGGNPPGSRQSLMRRPHSRDAQAMEELARSVEQFKREKAEAGEQAGRKPEP